MRTEYDYSKLKGRLVECGFTQAGLAKRINMSPATLNLKLNNKSVWTQDEIVKCMNALDLKTADPYFFRLKLWKSKEESE